MPTHALSHTLSLSASASSSSSDALSSSFSVVNGMRNNNNVSLFYCVCISRCLFHCHCCTIIVITVSLMPSSSPSLSLSLALHTNVVQTSFCMFHFVGSVLNQTSSPRILCAVFRGSLFWFSDKTNNCRCTVSVSFHDLSRLKGRFLRLNRNHSIL